MKWNQCIPSKVIEEKRKVWRKIKSLKGNNSAKIWRMITNIKLDLYFTMIYHSANLIKSVHLFITYWTETDILIQQQWLSRKRAITRPKFGGWLPISNLTCILQCYIFPQTSNEISASLLVTEGKSTSSANNKNCWKRAITQPKFAGWLPILKLTCIKQWDKLLQTLKEINGSF